MLRTQTFFFQILFTSWDVLGLVVDVDPLRSQVAPQVISGSLDVLTLALLCVVFPRDVLSGLAEGVDSLRSKVAPHANLVSLDVLAGVTIFFPTTFVLCSVFLPTFQLRSKVAPQLQTGTLVSPRLLVVFLGRSVGLSTPFCYFLLAEPSCSAT